MLNLDLQHEYAVAQDIQDFSLPFIFFWLCIWTQYSWYLSFFPKLSTLGIQYECGCWWIAEAREFNEHQLLYPREKAGSAGHYWSNNRLVAQKTLYVYYPESSKVLASPCFVSLRLTERWQAVSPECLTRKLSGSENATALVLCSGWVVQSALSTKAPCSKAAEMCNSVCLCKAHLSDQLE